MAKQDVTKALRAMGNDAVRANMAKGDFSDVPELELTAEEQQLVRDAAGDYPDVAGFAFDAFIGSPDGLVVGTLAKPGFDDVSAKYGLAVKYTYKE